MATSGPVPRELCLTEEEQVVLRNMIEQALRETRVEVHRTHHSPDFRAQVQHHEQVLRDLLAKMGSKSA